jgi:hypothetical protein
VYCPLIATWIVLITVASVTAGAFVEIGTGYNMPLGTWRDVYGSGMTFGGNIGFTFGEFFNPEISGFLLFPSVGKVIQDEYEQEHGTASISLFSMASLLSLGNRIFVALSDRDILTFHLGYGIFSQRDYVTVVNTDFETIENLAGHGATFGIGYQHPIDFSVFDHIHPFLRCYFAPNEVTYHIVDQYGTLASDYQAGENRMGIMVGVSLISIGEE